ncbi:ribosomal protein 63, mitochondrial [Carlito syrichta]|uniref:Ribosomal protein 63, mitochondrial n=1 Tax=Carlito syrichta TaxID=1868482 RepID=A0A3Q0ECB2_CARSF|nr:ribosomal protein 63, mitochondrial [Carlito syrichta]
MARPGRISGGSGRQASGSLQPAAASNLGALRVSGSAQRQAMVRRLEVEAENHYWLSAPYMTAEQERGHAAERRARAFEALKAACAARFPPHRLVEPQLRHLEITRKWT